MNHFITSCGLWIGVLFFCSQPLLQAQEKCGTNTETTTVVTTSEPSEERDMSQPPKKYAPLISEQTSGYTKRSKLYKKRIDRFKRRHRNRKKGCPATRF